MERREVLLPFPPCKAVSVPRPVAKDSGSGLHAVSIRWVLVQDARSMHPASAPLLGRVHTGGERFFGVNGDVASFGRVTP